MTENNNTNNQPQQEPELDKEHLGLAGRITKQFINSPVTPLLMMAFLAIGLLGLFFTPRQEDPKISVPMVDVFVQYPGASAEQVASLVTEPLERLMSEIPGVRHVYSGTQRGGAMVTVRFYVGEKMGPSIVKVHDKIQSNLDKIPPDVSMPLVKPVGIDDVPTVTVTMWSRDVDDSTLRTLGFDVLQRLNEVPNTGKGFVVGGRAERIRVEILPERLAGFGISPQQIAHTITSANSEKQAGNVVGDDKAMTVYTGAFIHSADDVSRLVVGVRSGVPIYVRDVARVFMAPAETKQIVNYYSGAAKEDSNAVAEAAVTIAVAKKIDTNGVTVSKNIIKKLESLKGTLIPDNVHVEITRDYGKTADHKVNELLKALFEAAVAVSILCLIGLGLRAASVVIIIIPIVILVTIWSAWILNYTIDRVSLFALVFSIGILVDDATVVVENIFRRWLTAGKTTMDIAIDAVREVGNPTILATLTIISAMLPMGFVSGLMGPYMRPIPVLGASAMFFSLIAAFVFAPWMAMRVRPKLEALKKAEHREEKFRGMVGRFYRPFMKPLCTNRAIGLMFLFGLIAATLLSCMLFYTQSVVVKMLPFDNKPEFNVVINMPEGTALAVTANVTSRLAEELRVVPEVTDLQTYVGTASPFNFNGMVRHYYLRDKPWQADIQVMLLDKNDRDRSSHDIAEFARHTLTPIAKEMGARIQVVEMPPGPPVLQTVVAEIYGPTSETRRQLATEMTALFEEVPNIVDVDNYMAEPFEYWQFNVDMDKTVRRGISVDTINNNLSMAMGDYKLGDIKRGAVREPTYIIIQVPLPIRSQVERLGGLPIPTSDGGAVPLRELGRFIRAKEQPIIYHQDLRPVEYVTGEMEGRLGAPIYGMFGVEDLLEKYTAPDGVKITGMPWGLIGPPEDDNQSGFEWGGEWTVTYETFRDMGGAFMAALVLIYGLIVWEFKNFKLAGLIMAPIPLTLIGIIPGHWIMGAEFTATSMIGFIALAGIIVRNSILLVEFVKHEVENGKDIREAVILAGQTRMRPIFITSLTLMAGAAAILSDFIFQGMAVSLLFGAGVSTILTLVVIPLGCISAQKQFYLIAQSEGYDIHAEEVSCEVEAEPELPPMPLWMRIYSKVVGAAFWIFYIVRGIYLLLSSIIVGLLEKYRGGSEPGPDDNGPAPTPPPSSPPPTGSGGDGDSGAAAPNADKPGTAQSSATKPAATKAEPEQPVKKKTTRKKTAHRKIAPAKEKTPPQEKTSPGKASEKPKPAGNRPHKRRGIKLKTD
ncbi:MAG: efflux RND transporter permease subunit [Proteobacteria bacterium]|nr:efflux RND transporter permease subunit [Pseudomonadota bacterium]